MRKDTFEIKVIHDGMESTKENNRATFMKLMEGIRDQFVNNNEYAKKFVKVIPEVDTIEINVDRNRDCDIPFVTCIINDESYVIRIPRFHRIIWGILLESSK